MDEIFSPPLMRGQVIVAFTVFLPLIIIFRPLILMEIPNFLINEIKEPGAGGLLIIEVNTYEEALKIIKEDPMIKNKIVDWKLNEWIDISKE